LRLLYVVTEDWYFLSHRLPMARAARDAGFEVHVATHVADDAAAIVAEGFALHHVPFVRGRLSPYETLGTILALRRVSRAVRPDVAHHVALQAAVLGAIAGLGRTAKSVNALTGLGYTFTSDSTKARLLRAPLTALLRRLLDRPGHAVLVQNPDDRDNMLSLGIAPERIAIISGSGVDTEALQPLPEPQGPPTIGFVGRLLADKGVHTLLGAHRLLRRRGSQIELLIAGTPDSANPTSVSEREAASWNLEPGVTWLGHVDVIRELWARAHIAVLPSRREGLPKSLLEAAAFGRPMIATDVPGCREVAIAGETGLLVPAGDEQALADAIEALAASAELRAAYGAAARRLAVAKFSSGAIGRQTVDLYRRLVG
jgi:glycosyltransferase involved in cell wall biosynthesis